MFSPEIADIQSEMDVLMPVGLYIAVHLSHAGRPSRSLLREAGERIVSDTGVAADCHCRRRRPD